MIQLPEGVILCTIDNVGFHPNIPHEECLASVRSKIIRSKDGVELVEIAFKNDIFQFNEKALKQLPGTAISIKFTPPYAILFMIEIETNIFGNIEQQPRTWRRYIDDRFFYLATWRRHFKTIF